MCTYYIKRINTSLGKIVPHCAGSSIPMKVKEDVTPVTADVLLHSVISSSETSNINWSEAVSKSIPI